MIGCGSSRDMDEIQRNRIRDDFTASASFFIFSVSHFSGSLAVLERPESHLDPCSTIKYSVSAS